MKYSLEAKSFECLKSVIPTRIRSRKFCLIGSMVMSLEKEIGTKVDFFLKQLFKDENKRHIYTEGALL